MTPTNRPRGRPTDASVPDRGCSVSAECVSCPWAQCIAELAPREHSEFIHALRLVRSYVAAPDTTIAP